MKKFVALLAIVAIYAIVVSAEPARPGSQFTTRRPVQPIRPINKPIPHPRIRREASEGGNHKPVSAPGRKIKPLISLTEDEYRRINGLPPKPKVTAVHH